MPDGGIFRDDTILFREAFSNYNADVCSNDLGWLSYESFGKARFVLIYTFFFCFE